MPRQVRVLREADVRSALDMAACIDACETAFAAYATGAAELPSVIHLDVPEAQGEIHVKAGHLHGSPRYAVKVASGFYSDARAAIDGMVVVFDAYDGAPVAFLLDNGFITDLRTGAAGGVAARHLAPDDTTVVAVVGTGGQAVQQLDALRLVRPGVREVRVWGRSAERAESRATMLQERLGSAVTVRPASTVRAAVEGSDVVITCTAAREPLVTVDMIESVRHITAVGSDGVGKHELDPEILRAADLLVVDSREQCARLGELQHAPDLADRAVELGTICAGRVEGRQPAHRLTVCDLTGVGVQDVAAANAVMDRAAPDLGDTLTI